MDQVRQGLITVEQAEVSPLQNVLSRALGVGEHVDVEANDFPVESGDVILLCSDGLTRMVKDEQILQVLKEKENPQEICENLISMANNAGGKDNVTVIVARIEKEPNTLERLWKAWFSKGESH
jgi:protein phosphatase